MGKLGKRIGICLLLAAVFWCGSLLSDRENLTDRLVRLHVVAHSDSPEDQAVKLQVRDAVLESIQQDLAAVADAEAAKAYLRENLPKLQAAANSALRAAGVSQEAVVTLCREAFDTRHYDTFSLPAGMYEALRVTIGAGEGHNWWCVAFPALCLPATTEAFGEAAVEAGLSEPLTGALSEEDGYEVRFFFLDALGKVQNRLFGEK